MSADTESQNFNAATASGLSSLVRRLLKRLHNLLEAAGVIGMVLTLLAFVSPYFWLADLCANLRIQLVIGLLVTTAAALIGYDGQEPLLG